jgi:hypothetical protein
MVYIGQSINIETRYLSHISNILCNKSSKKVLAAYLQYGMPSVEILIECRQEELNKYENEAIEIFDSFNNGFNSLETAEEMPKWKNKLKGEVNGAAIYNNQQILDAVKLMCNPNLTLYKIAKLVSVKYATIRKISQGKQHLWIMEQYPELWSQMQLARADRAVLNSKSIGEVFKHKFSAKSQGINYPQVISPTGEVHTIDNLNEFCRTNQLERTNFRNMLNGKRQTCRQWKVYKVNV